MVSDRVERIRDSYERLKNRRFGFLVRPLTLVVGWIVIIAGVIMIPFPGQGWLTVFIGVSIMSLEAPWARGLLTWGVRAYDGFFEWYHRQPRHIRWALISAMLILIFGTFAVLTWAFWYFGMLDFMDAVFVDQLGWSQYS